MTLRKRRARDVLPAPPGLCVTVLHETRAELAIFEYPLPDLDFPPELTHAERDVVRAVLSGLTNRQIARSRGSHPSTVSTQLRATYRKLGVHSRMELAAKFASITSR